MSWKGKNPALAKIGDLGLIGGSLKIQGTKGLNAEVAETGGLEKRGDRSRTGEKHPREL